MAKLIVLIVAVIAMVAAPQGAEAKRWFPPAPKGQQCWIVERMPSEPQAGYVGAGGEAHSFGWAEEMQVCVYVLRHVRAE